ncbi:hypothetical protein [Streptomyces sp. NPDC006879]|uniref:hypothetical protein n=1 Tax=Streptomyces sp. NPDC006879 TaxID=3364767 RepID=UPI0036D16990
MEIFLFLAVIYAPVLAPCVVVGAAVLIVRVRKQRPSIGHLSSVATCALVAVMAAAVSFGAYSWGVTSGFYILDPDQVRAAQGVEGDRIVTRWTLPVSSQCVTSGGVGTELASAWVNPVIFIGLAVSILALLAAVLAGVLRRRSLR